MPVGVGLQPGAMEDPTGVGRAQAQGDGGVHSASWGNQRGGGRAGGRLQPEVKVPIGRDRPPRLGGDAVIFDDMREFSCCVLGVQAADDYHKPRAKRPVISRKRELVDSTIQILVSNEIYDGKPRVDLSNEEPMQGR